MDSGEKLHSEISLCHAPLVSSYAAQPYGYGEFVMCVAGREE